MTSFLLALALKSTLWLLAGFAAAGVMARGSAAARHRLWCLALVAVLLLPLAMLTLPPLAVPLRAAPRPLAIATSGRGGAPPLPATPPLAAAAAPRTTPAPPQRTIPWSWGLAAVWLLGALALGLRWIADWAGAQRLGRQAQPANAERTLELRALGLRLGQRRPVRLATSARVEVPQASGLQRPIILLPPAAVGWTEERRRVVLLHELAHIRRGDCAWLMVAAWAAALYWWNPLVWLAARRLRLASELACDQAALAAARVDGVAPHDYAAHLLAIARALLPGARPAPLAAAMASTSQLEGRVNAILAPRGRRSGRLRTILVFGLFAACVFPLGAARLTQGTTQAAPRFDAASVKPAGQTMDTHIHERGDPEHLSITANLHFLILEAYGINPKQLGGEPDWFKTQLYAINATTSTPVHEEQMMLMLRSLLADRFQLHLRQEERDMPVFALEVAPGGPKFHELKPGEQPQTPDAPSDTFVHSFPSIAVLVDNLNGTYGGRLRADRLVVDQTHLTGRYNMVLETPIEILLTDGRRTLQFPELAHDLQSELGLKLVATHAPMAYFLVAHAAKPTPN